MLEEPSINIDLIPAEEKIKRSKEKAQKIGLAVSIVLFLAASIISAILLYYTSTLDQQIGTLNDSIEQKKKKISEKSSIEVMVRNLDAKHKTLGELLNTRIYYSLLMEEMAKRVPKTVVVTSLDSTTADKLNLSGTATDYVSLAKFLNSLTDPQVSTASAQGNMFKEVLINTVTLDPLTSQAKFSLAIGVDTSFLTKE